MDLARLLDRECVKVPLEGLTRDEVIAELVELLVRAGKVDDRAGFLDALYAREQKGSTGIGGGVAIPHARHPEVDDILLAVGISPDGMEFEAADDEPVHLVFLLMGSPEEPSRTIEALAEIGILVQIPTVFNELLDATKPAEVITIIEEAHEEQ